MLKAIFRFFADIREDRMKAQPDYYANRAREMADTPDTQIRDQIDPLKTVNLQDMGRVLKSLGHNKDHRHSSRDFNAFLRPVFNDVVSQVKKENILCWVKPFEDIMDGHVKAGALLEVMDRHILPDGGETFEAKSVEDVARAAAPKIDKNALGVLQKKMHEKFPLRTPTSDVVYEPEQTDQDLNLKRAFLLALHYVRDAGLDVERDNIPLYSETLAERAEFDERRAMSRTYRGRRY